MNAIETIPCLSILQPYAWLIVNGIKPVENRTWSTRFRGRVLIHAGKTYSKGDHAEDLEQWLHRGYPTRRDDMIGGIVGEAVITNCVSSHPSEWFYGPYGFVMDKPKAYTKLIPYRGALGFFNVPASVLDGGPTDEPAGDLWAPGGKGSCSSCGCTWNRACLGGCYWVRPGLCSACEPVLD